MGLSWFRVGLFAVVIAGSIGVFALGSTVKGPKVKPLSRLESLGKQLFNDGHLSEPHGMSCANCHAASAAFTDADRSQPVSGGAVNGRVGKRNAPSIAYMSFSPPFHYDEEGQTYVGGVFWDGRASDLEEQVHSPLFGTLEMHNNNAAKVVTTIRNSDYAKSFCDVYGPGALNPAKSSDRALEQMARAIAAYEASPQVNQFTSKFDYYLKGRAALTAGEAKGLQLFNGKANCFACHPSTIVGDEPAPLFTDFTYDNIGIPKNWKSPFLKLSRALNPSGTDFVDLGLAETVSEFDPVGAMDEAGKFKVPTLRNLALTAPYGHNGYFTTIKQIVQFYNTHDVPSANWPEGEVPETVNHDELGNLLMSDEEVDAVVAFLLTLTDGYTPN